MANVDAAFGFRPVNRDGSPYNGATLRCVFAAADATAAFIGDPVILDGSSSEGYPGVSQCAAGEPGNVGTPHQPLYRNDFNEGSAHVS